jgi:hypothetical protein
MNRIDKVLVTKRLGQKFDRPGLDSSNGHRNVTMCGDKDDREIDL